MMTFSQKAKQAIASFALISTTVFFTPMAYSAVPVVDVKGLAEAVKQVNFMRQQIKAITDNGNYAELLKNPALRKELNRYLPKNYTDITQVSNNADLQAIYQQVLNAEKNRQSNMTGEERVKLTSAMTEAQMIGMMKTLDVRSHSVNSLINQINRTQNTAQKQDLMNTLQAEQAQIQIDLNKMQVMMKMMEHQQRLAEQQSGNDWAKKRNR